MTTYRFTIGNNIYTAAGDNRLSAQLNIEVSTGISLKGAKFEEIYKLKVIRTGVVKR